MNSNVKWVEITMQNYNGLLDWHYWSVSSTFTDMSGTHPLGYGIPAMDTEYSLKEDETIKLRTHSTLENGKWVDRFYRSENNNL